MPLPAVMQAGVCKDSVAIGIYIHIPFCLSKCSYCDFLSFDDRQSGWEIYLNNLIGDIEGLNENFGLGKVVDTIYIGGGTPTVWPPSFLSKLLKALHSSLTILPGAEITCEANPGTLSVEKIETLVRGGVNRVSLGLQAVQPHLLKNIGRKIVGWDIFFENYYALRKAGIGNINIDVMFALPGQSEKDWEETLHKVYTLSPEHISAYALTPDAVDEEIDRAMYHRMKSFMLEQGYSQYELSNFAKPDFESRHNIRYWTRKSYIGLGLGAHSFSRAKEERWSNTEDGIECLKISKTEAMAEFMFLGLRMTRGVLCSDFEAEFGQTPYHIYGDWINKMVSDGLLLADDSIKLTDLGMDLANRVMVGFL